MTLTLEELSTGFFCYWRIDSPEKNPRISTYGNLLDLAMRDAMKDATPEIKRLIHFAGARTGTRCVEREKIIRYGIDYLLVSPEAPAHNELIFQVSRFGAKRFIWDYENENEDMEKVKRFVGDVKKYLPGYLEKQ